jgi:similar to stage IV sporulation protein
VLIRLFRFLQGYVCFCAADGFPERFLNLCANNRILLWNVVCKNGVLRAAAHRKNYKRLHACAKASGCTLRLQKKVGLPFFLHAYRRRVGLLIGLGLLIGMLTVLSQKIWSVEVRGNERLSDETLLTYFAQNGLKPGVWRGHTDIKSLEAKAMQDFHAISWLSVNVHGSSAMIEISERVEVASETDDTPQNIVARKDGQLVVLEIYAGQRIAKLGDAVTRGNLLASGIVENKDGTTRLEHARAYAVAQTRYAHLVAIKRKQKTRTIGSIKTHYTISFLGLRIPLGCTPREQDGKILLAQELSWMAGGKKMPLALERRSVLRLEESAVLLSDAQLCLYAAHALFEEAYDNLRGTKVLEQNAAIKMDSMGATARLEGTAHENIGEAAAIASGNSMPAEE